MTGLVQYDMPFINFLREKGDIPELSMDVIQVINDLAKKVGAPTYNKTPVFKKRNRQPRKKDNMITKQDWENIRNFKLTKLDKNEEGFECIIDDIRSNLNKLTKENFDEINDTIKKIIRKQIIKEDNTDENLNEIAKCIFEIGSLNTFWSSLDFKPIISFLRRLILRPFFRPLLYFSIACYLVKQLQLNNMNVVVMNRTWFPHDIVGCPMPQIKRS